jgi:cytochrome c-type biogenesis protein CcmI
MAWLFAGVLSAAVVAVITLPLLRRTTGDASDATMPPPDELASARRSLTDISQRRDSGALTAEEAGVLRALEARRLFALTQHSRHSLNRYRRLMLAGLLIVALPAFAWAIYSLQGVPNLPDLPLAGRALGPGSLDGVGASLLSAEQRAAFEAMTDDERAAAVATMVDGLAARLAVAPHDVAGWLQLGRAYLVQSRIADGRAAYAEAADRAPDNIAVQLAYAEALLAGQLPDAAIPPPLITVMQRVNRLDDNNPNALYVLGLAAARTERWTEAEAHWSRLTGLLPPDSTERAALEDALARIRQELP